MINGVKAHKRIVDVPRQLLSCCHKMTCSAQTTVVWYPPPSSTPPSEWPPNLPVTSFLTEGIWWTKPSTGCQNDPPPHCLLLRPAPPPVPLLPSLPHWPTSRLSSAVSVELEFNTAAFSSTWNTATWKLPEEGHHRGTEPWRLHPHWLLFTDQHQLGYRQTCCCVNFTESVSVVETN